MKPPEKVKRLAGSFDLDHLEVWGSKIYRAIIGARKSLDRFAWPAAVYL